LKDKVTTNSGFKKFKKILLRTIMWLVVFLLFLAISLQLPFVQTWIAHYATSKLNESYGTHIYVDKVGITIFGGVKMKGILIMDHHNDTLISAQTVHTNVLSFRNLGKNKFQFGTLNAHSLNFHMKTYKGENASNFDTFVKAFDTGKPGDGSFRLTADDIYVAGGHFRLTNENAVTHRVLDLKKLSGHVQDFLIKGPEITAQIKKLSLLDHRGLFVENLTAGFSYTKTHIILKEAEIKTAESELSGTMSLAYTKAHMKDFVNLVPVDFNIKRASVSSNELNLFFPEFGKDQKYYLSTHLTGPLNNFVLHDLKLLDDKHSEIIGTVNFRHLFDKKGPGFYMDANFSRVTSQYANLRGIMPRILGKSLPVVLEKFGKIDLVGHVVLTKQDLTTQMYVMSELGEAQADLKIKGYNKPDEAMYTGSIDLDGFNLGAITGVKTMGLATLHADVDGKGFRKESLNTIVKGAVTGFAFNGYNYKNITIDGRLKWPYFKGNLNSNDPNLLMSFDGLVDMSKRVYDYDFHAQIDYADLAVLKLMKNDTISIFKGDMLFEASGNNINDIAGTLQISRLSYQNSRDSYFFEDFFVSSSFDENNERTIAINSQDIIEGRVTGKFDINEVPKIFQNGLGSLYTNYTPYKVKKGQYLDYDFTIYNKIVGILFPDISVSKDTRLHGRVKGDNNEFVLAFNSPNIDAAGNTFDNVKIDVNNKNPLYNTYISMDSMRVKNYKVSDFSLINITQHDTLYVRTEFKGGNKQSDFYNLDLYHTIDSEKNSVVGFKKSEVNFKNFMWFINEDDAHDNKIVFDKKLKNFRLDNISMSHNDQRVELNGDIRGKDYKDLRLSFDDVDLNKVTPALDSLNFGGRLNGDVSLKQNKDVYQPASSLTIDSLKVNKYVLGDMKLDVTGDRTFRKFDLNTTITRDGDETFNTAGQISIANGQTNLSLDAKLTNFDISPLQVFLQKIFPEIRGFASGRAAIVGNAKNPEIDGRLYIKKGGVKVGYLNTGYNFEENATVDITENSIYFRNIELTDTKYGSGTKGMLMGEVRHEMFKNWKLGLTLLSDRILVLDTQESDDALYYGTAYIKGKASINGPVNALVIKVDATSAEGTYLRIPVSNLGTTSTTNAAFIHFLTPKEKEDKQKGIVAKTSNKVYKGLEMEFNLTVTPAAKIEVIIDKNTGHSLASTGNGYLLLQINTLGKFNMFGDYQVVTGDYFFRYGGVIDKKFIVKPGGTINWEGDPTRARLNLEAVYKTTANPSVLLEAPTSSRNISTEVVISLQGSLLNPEPDFTINFPGISSVLKSDLDYRLSDMDTRQTQALALLGTGAFISPTNANSAVYGSFFEKANSLFNDLLSDGSSNINIGINYVQPTRNPYVDTNSQIGLTLSSQINDRVTINGQLGVPVGGVNQSSIVGNIEVKLRVNNEGTLNARVFNRENDINFLGEGIGYTQGVGMTYEVDFDTFNELWKKIFKNAEVKADENTANPNEIPDSDIAPEFIKFTESRNKKKNVEEKQPDPIPEVDN
jgi:TamB, inner membrane protein subunit of TAM complex